MFYDQFVKLCRDRGISPAMVTREIGLNNSSSTAWKRGSIPKGDTLQKLAEYFHVTVDYLLGVEEPMPIPSSIFIQWLTNQGFLFGTRGKGNATEYFIHDLDIVNSPKIPVSREQLNELERNISVYTKFQVKEFLRNIHQAAHKSATAPPEGRDTTPGSEAPTEPPEGE